MKASFEYKSRFTGEPCVCIVTGADGGSANRKTGKMAQVWFLLRDLLPHLAVKEGYDRSVCGTCPLRSGRGCYVRTEQAPLSIWRKWHAGGYREELPKGLPPVRFGAYGDPASVPKHRWNAFIGDLCGHGPWLWTGYTHGWRRAPWLREWCMASVETCADACEARDKGWSVFQTVQPDYHALVSVDGEECLAVSKGLHCYECLRCHGSSIHRRRWIQIPAHGARKNMVHAG